MPQVFTPPAGARIAVGISGGVDSSVAAHLLQRAGYEVFGIFMKNWEESFSSGYCTLEEDIEDARDARRASGRREWQSIIADQESGAVEQTPSRPEPPDDDSRDLLTILAASPMSAEALASRLGWPIDRILITIQLLELGGYIGRHVDGRWQRLD